MKKILIVMIIVLFFSCNDKDKEKYEFINNLINNPENYESIIKGSRLISPFSEQYMLRFMKDRGKELFKNYFTGNKSLKFSDTTVAASKNKNYITNIIKIESNNKVINFGFWYFDNNWYLYNVAEHELLERPNKKDNDIK
ncbi:MAG: hypothetical protein HZB41_08955 [Ignavibacteriae bacterium]|nr:hypothetical protein [Ignavibacteriota bacterium]